MEVVAPAEIHSDDAELYLALAQIQSIHNTLRKTRHAPTGVISPLRNAARSAQQPNPQYLAALISKAAAQGRQDIQALKSIWTGASFKRYNREANEANLEQGNDSWEVDYEALARQLRKREKQESRVEERADSLEEATKIAEEFDGSQRKGILSRMEKDGAELAFVLVVGNGKIEFVVKRGRSTYQITASSKDEFVRPQSIAEYVQKTPAIRSLKSLLELLEAYHDITQRQCEICKNLFDDELAFTTVRKEGPKKEGEAKSWLAYHSKCEP